MNTDHIYDLRLLTTTTATLQVDPAVLAEIASLDPGVDGAKLGAYVRQTRLKGVPNLRLRDSPATKTPPAAAAAGVADADVDVAPAAAASVANTNVNVSDEAALGTDTATNSDDESVVKFSKTQVSIMSGCVLVAIFAVLVGWARTASHAASLANELAELEKLVNWPH